MVEVEIRAEFVNVNDEGVFIGYDAYYIKGTSIRHRVDGPAQQMSDGSKFWYYNGNLHREDGPAFQLDNGVKLWYLNGELVATNQIDFERVCKMKVFL